MAASDTELPVIFQHPLAYLLGLEGIALLRAFSGAYDREFTLARAREKVPHGEFHEADLNELPLPDDSVDLVVCAIALVHLAEIEGPFREFARVLRPGGHLVVSDQRGLIADIGLPVVFDGPQ